VAILLPKLFGDLKFPMLAGHSLTLCFDLLLPARRPIQITSDLADFWEGSCVDEVAKGM
jgi:ATP-dependent helicase HrpB